MLRPRHMLVTAVTALAIPLPAPAQQRTTVEGVWKVVERVTTGANAFTNTSIQPNLYIFTRGYYSVQRVNGNDARPSLEAFKDAANPTDAEKLGRFTHWNVFTSNGGTYSLQGTTLTINPIVAKNRSVEGVPQTMEVRVDGNTAWLIQKSAAGQPASETRTKLTRVE